MNDYKPEVGEQIEYELHSGEDVWYEAVAVCKDLGGMVFRNENGYYFNSNDNRIRPIRTQQEVGREKAIKDACKNIGWDAPGALVAPSCIGVVIDMIDAGYHNGPKTGAMVNKYNVFGNVRYVRKDGVIFLSEDDLFDNYDVFSKIKD